jgi:cytochrome c biogenesis protein CcmG, thiol:disulfide interchange protein DsbE
MSASRRSYWTMLPVALFAGLAFMFWLGLQGDPSKLPSTMLGRPAPEFALPAIEGATYPSFASANLARGKVTLVNIFASWCGPCRDEHPILLELAKRGDIVLAGINNKDSPEDARRFLSVMGNPYAMIGADLNGRVSIDWGGYGVPETFVVDGQGVIRYKVIGPITPDILDQTLNAEIEKAKQPIARK